MLFALGLIMIVFAVLDHGRFTLVYSVLSLSSITIGTILLSEADKIGKKGNPHPAEPSYPHDAEIAERNRTRIVAAAAGSKVDFTRSRELSVYLRKT